MNMIFYFFNLKTFLILHTCPVLHPSPCPTPFTHLLTLYPLLKGGKASPLGCQSLAYQLEAGPSPSSYIKAQQGIPS